MVIERKEQSELTVKDLDRLLIAKGAQIPVEEIFKFEDSEGTDARDAIMTRIKELYASAPSLSSNEDLDFLDIYDLARMLIHKTGQIEENRSRGIWYEDHRMDYFGIQDKRVKKNADGTAAITLQDNLIDLNNGFSELKVKNYGEVFNLCEVERFRDQPVSVGPICTGFLVKKDTIATAAHFVNKYNIADLRIVFGYRMSAPTCPVIQIPNENIYKAAEITHRVYRRIDLMGDGTDFVLVQLGREVKGQEVITLSKCQAACQQSVYVIGYPLGLPLKYAPGAHVRGIEKAYFSADLDVYMGNSGSPVFNSETHEVVGMVVRGDTRDLRWTGKGWASVIYPHREIKSIEPQCTRASEFIEFCQ
jgi:hypothetical protein